MTTEKFKKLISRPEGSTLDFKRDHYNLDSKDEREEAKLIKDVLACCNTIRTEASYIIIGVEESKGQVNLIGLNKHYDDALIQDKVKDKISPRPIFKYYSFEYESLRFGILEFPVTRYPLPLTPTKKMKGLEIGCVYHRRGSTNTNATSIEAIQINEWISNVKESHIKQEISDSIHSLITDVQSSEFYSPILSESLKIAREINFAELVEFCENELKGWKQEKTEFEWTHRNIKVYTSFKEIISATFSAEADLSSMWNELKQDEDFWPGQIFLGDPISQIESQIRRHQKGSGNQFATKKIMASEMFKNSNYKENDLQLFIYWNEHNIAHLYDQSKQKLISLLMDGINEYL